MSTRGALVGSALMAVGLVAALTQCGVPPASQSPSAVDVFYQPVAAAVSWSEGAEIVSSVGSGAAQMRLVIPPGVLTEDASVSISRLDVPPDASSDSPPICGPIYDIQGLEGKIDGLITIVLPYTSSWIPAGSGESDVFTAFWDGADWAVVGRSAIDLDNHTVTVETYHASKWVAFAEHPYEIQPNAGKDQVVVSGDVVQLNATDSTPVRKSSEVRMPSKLTYRWWQMTGTPVTLDDETSATPNFIAPDVTFDMNLRFELEVICGYSSNHSAKDTVTITVSPRPAPGQASNPTPAHGAVNMPTTVVLEWTPSESGATHDLYVGTSLIAIDQATPTSSEYKGNLSAAEYSPPTAFAADSTVYWRVDEITSAGTTKGQTWQFATLPPVPAAASDPTPTDGQTLVDAGTLLSWEAGSGATQHDVYLGTNEAMVDRATTADSPIYCGRQASVVFAPTTDLGYGTTYYWRVDEVNAAGVTKGSVYEFTTIQASADKATDPLPASGATLVPITASLSWRTGLAEATHDVYFGANAAGVTYATTSDAEFKGNQAGTTYDIPGDLTAGQTYYWRIDEVTEAGITKGTVWSFTTIPPLPGLAGGPDPADAATDVSTSLLMSWTAGSDATQHDVYLGTDSVAVTDAEYGDSPIFRGRQAGRYYNASGQLLANTTYY
ncbi:MAG: hypothetical protein JXQ73_20605, partial [Phycisphaerae bacterium]|nr:hypothetical protein [Phycisphaerae bacterium]